MAATDETGGAGKTRTWWHPLLVRLLEYALSPAFEVRDEVSVGTLPLRADIVLLRREPAEIPELARTHLSAIVQRLNQWTLIEFKSPMDSLQQGDLDRLFGVAHLFCSQQTELIPSEELTLIILAPAATEAFRREIACRGLSLVEDEPGVQQIENSLFAMWLLETDRLTGPDEPALTVFSRVFLRDRQLIMDLVRNPGTAPILRYVYQQIEQFHLQGESFMVQHTHTAEMDQEYAAFKEAFVASLTPDERLHGLSPDERLHGLSPDERLQGLSPDERLHGLSPDEVLRALDPEERRRLRELLLQENPGGSAAGERPNGSR